MKKIISFICMTMMLLSMSITALAGSIPEDLLHSDDAQIFFAEVVAYHPDKESPDIEFSPVKKIKGDVKTGTKQIAYNINTIGNFDIKVGNVYLFTYFDENNETNIFEVTSYDTATLKIKNTDFDIWKRFESYLNDGEYEKAEQERIDKINAALTEEGDEISLAALLGVKKENCDKVKIHLNGVIEGFEIDKDKFFDAAEDIFLTDIKNVLAETSDSFDIIAYEGEKTYIVNMWDKCLVGSSRVGMYSAPMGDYTIKASDYEKLVSLFPEEAKVKLPPLNNPPANLFYWIFYNPTEALVIGVFIIIVLVGVTGFIIGYKVKKKTRRR